MINTRKKRIFAKISIDLIIPTIVLIYFVSFQNHNSLIQKNKQIRIQGVIVTLIRSTNVSIFLTLNMIHSVIQFYPTRDGNIYPFVIFHDENFTSVMREQILSCVLKTKRKIKVSFARVNFQTSVQPHNTSRANKPIGYRLMCRFWTYDVFYHPAIIQGKYDYLMRMDDDSYFSNVVREDLFLYMYSRKLDYIYRSTYSEPFDPMHSILRRFTKKKTLRLDCIYNNLFAVRLKWYYESKRIQSFVHELIQDDLILREYIGDGCIHSAMLEIDDQVNVQQVVYISYGHNFHLMPSGYWQWKFHQVNALYEEINKSCEQLTVLRGFQGILTRIKMS